MDQHDRPQGRVPQHTLRARILVRLDVRHAPRKVPLVADADGLNVGTRALLVHGGVRPQGQLGDRGLLVVVYLDDIAVYSDEQA